MTRAAIFSAFLLCSCLPVDSTRARPVEGPPDLLQAPAADEQEVAQLPDMLDRVDLARPHADLLQPPPACELQPDNGGCGCEGSPCCGGPTASGGFCTAAGASCHTVGAGGRTDTGTSEARCATCGGNGEPCCVFQGEALCDEGLRCWRWAGDAGANGLCQP